MIALSAAIVLVAVIGLLALRLWLNTTHPKQPEIDTAALAEFQRKTAEAVKALADRQSQFELKLGFLPKRAKQPEV